MTPSTEALESLFRAAVSASNEFRNQVVKLDGILAKITSEASSLNISARLKLRNEALLDFLKTSQTLLISPGISASTRSKLLLALFHICLYNVPIRKFLASDPKTCPAVFYCLQVSLEEQLGPQNLIDILRLLQVLTYEKIPVSDGWTDELIAFLLGEILRADEPEWMPYCIAILSNLVSRSKRITTKLKNAPTFPALCSRLLQLLSHNSRTVVVASLVLIGYLDDKTRDTVYSSQNISQTFLCIFNVLSSADLLMTVHIAVDLLRRLILAESDTSYGTLALSSTAKNFTAYGFFEKSIQKAANLFIIYDPRSEESQKVYDLLLSFCLVDELRSPVSAAIIGVEACEKRLTTPCHAMCRTAAMPFEEAIIPEVPLAAIRLLIFMMKEAVESCVKVRRLVPVELICSLIETCLKTLLDTKPGSELAPFQCAKIIEGLRLAEAVANDDEVRYELLEVANAALCAHIYESNLTSNPVVNLFAAADPSPAQFDKLPDWSASAVGIPIQLMRLLASLKDYSKLHKDLYWKSLKDSRLLPFIAFAIARGPPDLVFDAFVLFTHCAQVHEFSIKTLSNLTAKCSLRAKKPSQVPPHHQNGNGNNESGSQLSVENNSPNAGHSLDEEGMESMQNLVLTLQQKLSMHERRERELEQLIAQKDQQNAALSVANGNGTSDVNQISKFRQVIAELERKVIESDAEITALSSEKTDLVAKADRLQQLIEVEKTRHLVERKTLDDEREVLVGENEKERALHAILRARFDEMTRKFDTAAKAIFDKQTEMERLTKSDEEKTQRLVEVEAELDRVRKELETAKQTIEHQSSLLEERNGEIEHIQVENRRLQRLKSSISQLLNDSS